MKYIYAFCAILLMSLSSCLKDGDYTIPLEEGNTKDMVLGIWQVSECKLFDGEDYTAVIDDEDLLGQTFVINNNGKGTIIDGDTETEISWTADAAQNLLDINGVQYEIVSLGENLMILKPISETGAEVKHYFLVKKESIPAEEDGNAATVEGIPSDDLAEANPNVGETNAVVPNFQCIVEKDAVSGYHIARFDMTGISIPGTDNEWLKLFGTGMAGANAQNIWISIDDKPKGILVQNNSASEGGLNIKTDIVFLVDNSGTMSDEAEKLAEDIVAFSQTLSGSGLDVQFGCVGYDDYGKVSGALDIGKVEMIYQYLNERDQYGVSKTKGFYGVNAESLESLAKSYSAKDECGVVALRFADEKFTFRPGANRVYINFTDEPNQTGGIDNWSVEYVKNQTNWPSYKGAIHTVFSEKKLTSETEEDEFPWRLSEYTGGTTIYTSSSFEGVNLIELPFTGAMQNSYVIKFTNIEDLLDGRTHKVKITILSADGRVKAEKTFDVTFTVA